MDARVIAATNARSEADVAEQRFRQDLYYRLSVIVISVPPLRERRADIPLLVDQFLQSAGARAGRTVDVAAAALDALVGYDWPGNVRELENTIERAVLFSRGNAIHVADLPEAIARRPPVRICISACSWICRRSTSWSGAISRTCCTPSAAIARAPPKCWGSIAARSIGWRIGSASILERNDLVHLHCAPLS